MTKSTVRINGSTQATIPVTEIKKDDMNYNHYIGELDKIVDATDPRNPVAAAQSFAAAKAICDYITRKGDKKTRGEFGVFLEDYFRFAVAMPPEMQDCATTKEQCKGSLIKLMPRVS